MGVLETIDILGDARVVGPSTERGGEDGDDVGGLEAAAAALEVGKTFAEGHIVIEGGLLLEREDPGVFDDGDNERAPGALGRLDQTLQLDFGHPETFSLGSDGVIGVGGNLLSYT